MNKFLGDAMGADGVAKMAGKKVGTLVEDTVKNAMGGAKKEEKKQEGGGGGGGGFGDKAREGTDVETSSS
ncbi:hypothetical protein Q5P01_021889 [Channa striata]|uniref:Uncharacterized protein n=1 Tax=Channa striata TaxID=64152 RepID=A0AA88LUX1_CHASR|nr:hypothetical protein Q5P01_021889 [Channa striata]